MRKRLVACVLLAGLVTAVAMTAGGASGTRSTAAGKVTKVAIATPAKATDYGWNQQGLNGAAAAAKANGATLKSTGRPPEIVCSAGPATVSSPPAR